jgi:hypothetical protein
VNCSVHSDTWKTSPYGLCLDEFAHADREWVVSLHVSDHQDNALPLGLGNQFLTLTFRIGERLFHQHVLAGAQTLHPDRVMKVVRERNQHSVHVGQHVAETHRRRSRAQSAGGLPGALLVNVHTRHDLHTVREPVEPLLVGGPMMPQPINANRVIGPLRKK